MAAAATMGSAVCATATAGGAAPATPTPGRLTASAGCAVEAAAAITCWRPGHLVLGLPDGDLPPTRRRGLPGRPLVDAVAPDMI